ncbi:MAG: InlB B-repeat-containing protein [Spirochaetales bacterium]|nr:InlB B-repeat-containing protein [Spirochaetales bacterium]
MRKSFILLMVMFVIFACTQDCLTPDNSEKKVTDTDISTDVSKEEKVYTTLQQVVNDTNTGEEIDLSKYKDVTDYNATINKTLTIKNGSLDSAKLTVTAENVKLEKIEKVSVSTSSKLTITNSKLSDLLIGGGATSRSTTLSAEMSLAMVTVTDSEIENVELNGFNSQLNITDTITKIEDILISTKAKVILEAGSYDGMKDPTVTNGGEAVRVDMTKDTQLSVLSIYSSPQKLEYNIGDKIDLAGLIVMGTYSTNVETFKTGGWKGESLETITKWEDEKDYTLTYNFNIAGVSIVTVASKKYPEIKCNFHVYVKDSQSGGTSQPGKEEIEITDIILKTFGTVKTLYKVGEKLDLSGFQVVGKYNNFEINLPFTSEPANGTPLTTENTEITFYYDGGTLTRVITVTESHTVTFKDGENTLYTLEVADGESLKLPSNPTRENYTFDGWYNGETKIEADYKVTGDLTLTAEWNANTYTVKFNANGGSGTMTEQAFTYDTKQALTANTFTRDGYTFAGWATSADGNVTYADEQKVSNLTAKDKATVILYAVWNENGKVSPVIFSQPTAVDYNDSVTLSCATEGAKISYTIDGVTVEYSNAIVITEDVTITAFATKDGMKNSDTTTASYTVKTYTVTYKSDYGTVPSKIVGLKKDDKLTTEQLPKLTIDGYTFAGWYNGENEVTTEYKISSDVELTAKWNANTYTVKFDANGGSGEMTEQAFTYDAEQALTANTFTCDGYTFAGWATTASGDVIYADGKKVSNLTAEDKATVTLYAVWKENKAVITVTLPKYSDISGLTNPTTNTDGTVTFTAPSEYKNYNWYVDGVKQTTTSSTAASWTFSASDLSAGIRTIMLVVEDSAGNKYSAEYQLTVER